MNKKQVKALAWMIATGGGDVGDAISVLRDFYSHLSLADDEIEKIAECAAEVNHQLKSKALMKFKSAFPGVEIASRKSQM